MAETIKLDPTTIATNRTELDITQFISSEGIDWDQARIDAYQAQGKIGSEPVDYNIPNRQVTIPLILQARGTVSFETIRRQIQAKTALHQREGGWLSRVTSAGTLFADVVNASLKLGGGWGQAHKSYDQNAELQLELKPDWYGAEITLDDQSETSALAFTKVLKQSTADAVIAGDHPARVRIVVDEDDGDTQLGLVWGFRSRYYDAASTAALTYQAEALTPLDTAGTTALAGASGGTVMTHSSVRTDWTGVMSTTMLSGTAALTHKGTYRVLGRFYSTSGTTPDVRFVWRVGNFVNPIENDRVSIPAPSNFYWLDLGQIRLDPAPVGTHQWFGQVHAIGPAGGENVSVDALHFQPIDDGAGIVRAPQILPTITTYSVNDTFTGTTAGTALNGRTAPAGGSWVTSGDATDYAFSDDFGGEDIKRSTTSGTTGRFAILGTTNYAAVVVECTISSGGGLCQQGVIARWTDASNHLRAVVSRDVFPNPIVLEIHEVIAGTKTVIRSVTTEIPPALTWFNQWWVLRLYVTTGGQAVVQIVSAGKGETGLGSGSVAVGTKILETQISRSSLATGGTLATGKPGIFDLGMSGSPTRHYDDFRVAALPEFDATLYPNQSLELRTDGIFRENSGGNVYAFAPHIGDLPRLPPAGLENRKVEMYLNASRGDFDQIADTGIDDISAQVFYRPCWLSAPGS